MRRLLDWLNARYYRRSIGAFVAPRDIRPFRPEDKRIRDEFHRAYYSGWKGGYGTIDLSWMGYRTLKCPLDLWVYQEIMVETRPEIILECGTLLGGSALYLASMCELLGEGRVISVDLTPRDGRPQHRLIEYVTGSSTDPAIVQRVTAACAGKRVMAILDSDHSCAHVTGELKAYAPLIPVGGYLIVEDTNVNGHPVVPDFGPGPMEAVEAFLEENGDFIIDSDRERFMMTLNPNGFLKRIR